MDHIAIIIAVIENDAVAQLAKSRLILTQSDHAIAFDNLIDVAHACCRA